MNLTLRILLIACIGVTLLHIWAAIQPSHYNWGVHYFAFYDFPISLIALIAAVLLFIGRVQSKLISGLAGLVRSVARFPVIFVIVILTCIWVAALMFFDERVHLLGDSSLIIRLTPNVPTIEDATANFRNQPLTYFLLRTFQSIIGGGDVVEIVHLYTVVDIAAGIVFLLMIIGFTHFLKISMLDKTLIAFLLIFHADTQFFFGYVENYVFLYVAIIAYLMSGWLAFERNIHVIVPCVCMAIMIGLHLGSVIFVPSLLPLFIPFWRKHRLRSAITIVVVCLASFVLLQFTGYDVGALQQRMLSAVDNDILPLATPPFGIPNGIFSGLHIIDWSNAVLHIAVLECIMIVVLLIALRKTIEWRSPLVLFLLMTSACGLLFTIVMNPALGMARDWDLFANFFVPLRFLLVYLIIRIIHEHHVRRVIMMIAGITFLHWAAWIGVNASEERHLRRAEMLTTPQLSGTFPKIYYEHLGATFHQQKDYERSKRWYEAYFAVDSNNPRIIGNLAEAYSRIGDEEKKFAMLKRSTDLHNPNPGVYSNLAAEYRRRGDTTTAIQQLQKALALDSTYSIAHANLALIYNLKRIYPLAAHHATRAIKLGMTDPVLFRTAGYSYFMMNESPRALEYFNAYLTKVPNDTNIQLLWEQIRRDIEESSSRKNN